MCVCVWGGGGLSFIFESFVESGGVGFVGFFFFDN